MRNPLRENRTDTNSRAWHGADDKFVAEALGSYNSGSIRQLKEDPCRLELRFTKERWRCVRA